MLHTLDIIAKVLFVIVFFGLCIFIHELGHLLVALWQKLYVEKFSLGFGKKIWGTTINGVEYIISMLPFGGYVALPQLDPSDEPKTSDGTPLPSGPPVARMLTALAGPLANVLFGFFLGLFIWWFGAWEPVSQTKCEVLSVPPVLPLYQSGLADTDEILAVDGEKVEELASWWDIAQKLPGDKTEFTLQVKHEGSAEPVDIDYTGTPNPEYEAGLRPGDVIVAIDGEPFDQGFMSVKEATMLATAPVTFTVQRGDQTVELKPYRPAENPYIEDLGHPFFEVTQPVSIDEVIAGSVAEKAGLQKGDILLEVDGKTVENSGFFVRAIMASEGGPVDIKVQRGDEEVTIVGVRPEPRTDDGETVYQIGARLTTPKRLVYPTPVKQFEDVFSRTKRTLGSLFAPVLRKPSHVRPRHMSGPLGIFQMIFYKVLFDGYRGGLTFIILVTFSLAFFNLLPLPVLDGGHIVYSLVEIVFGRKIPTRIVYWLQTVFAVLLITFMLYVTFYDVKRTPRFFRLFRDEAKRERLIEEDEKARAAEQAEQKAPESAPADPAPVPEAN